MKNLILCILLSAMSQLIHGQKRQVEFDNMFRRVLCLDSITPSQSLDEGLKALAYANQINYGKGIVKATLFVCEYYIRKGNYAKALSYAAKSEKIKSLPDDWDKVKLKRVKAKCLTYLGFYEGAEKALDEILYYIDKLPDEKTREIQEGIIYADIGMNYYENRETRPKALVAYRKSLEIFNSLDNLEPLKKQYTFFILVKIASFYRKQKSLEKMQLYLKKATAFSDSLKNDLGKAEFFYNQGIVKSSEADFNAGKSYFQRSLKILKKEHKVTYRKELYYELFTVCRALQMTDSSRYYRRQYMIYSDSIHRMYKKNVSKAIHFFDEEKKQEMKESSFRYFIIIMLCVILVLVGSSKLFQFHKRYIVLKEEKKIIDDQLKENNSTLDQLKDKNTPDYIDNVRLEQLAKEGNQAFLIEFKKYYPDFYDKLIGLNLRINGDLKFCALIRLNFNTAEIADFTRSSMRAVESRKYRIRKRLEIPSGKDMYEWFQEL
ncbi:hypothetical protein [Flavobacterium cerinum]|uniref:Tetratricopeptide repeat protein n=1 Tax=Flavobacterium cerinum TaxID=2502784 RepID=A0ABY5ISX6_9FLAO|nr:hypothetical protein [Flavobacterium cerinum]UUC45894.1 hypothetical protein NOX80_01515 [Flavobacterium cerinum]